MPTLRRPSFFTAPEFVIWRNTTVYDAVGRSFRILILAYVLVHNMLSCKRFCTLTKRLKQENLLKVPAFESTYIITKLYEQFQSIPPLHSHKHAVDNVLIFIKTPNKPQCSQAQLQCMYWLTNGSHAHAHVHVPLRWRRPRRSCRRGCQACCARRPRCSRPFSRPAGDESTAPGRQQAGQHFFHMTKLNSSVFCSVIIHSTV